MKSFSITGNDIEVVWLFESDAGSPPYYWSTTNQTYGGNTYENKIVDFTGIKMPQCRPENRQIPPNTVSFSLIDTDHSLSSSDFVGENLTVRLLIDGVEKITWKFWIKSCTYAYGKHSFYCEDFLQKYLLNSEFPNNELTNALDTSGSKHAGDDKACIPVIYGNPYIPLRSIFDKSVFSYTVSGTPISTDTTITVSETISTNAPSYGYISIGSNLHSYSSFTGSTFTLSGVLGVDYSGGETLSIPMRWYVLGQNSGTYTITETSMPVEWSKTSTYTSTDYDFIQATIGSNKVFQVFKDGVPIGTFQDNQQLYDMPVKYSNSNTASTTDPSDIISAILQFLGVAAGDIDSTTFASAKTHYSTNNIEFDCGFYLRENAIDVLSQLLVACDSILRVEDSVKLIPRSSTSVKTLTRDDMSDYSFNPATLSKLYDAGYVNYFEDVQAGKSISIEVPVDGSTFSNISSESLLIPFYSDTVLLQQFGRMYFRRKYWFYGDVSFISPFPIVVLEPGDTITINDSELYESDVVEVNEVSISKDLKISISAKSYSYLVGDFDDYSPSAVATDTDSTDKINPELDWVNATKDLSLNPRNSCSVSNGNTISKSTGIDAWDSDCYSSESYTNGCFISFFASQNNKDLAAGFALSPTASQSYDSIDYKFVLGSDGNYSAGTLDPGVVGSFLFGTDDLDDGYSVGQTITQISGDFSAKWGGQIAISGGYYQTYLYDVSGTFLSGTDLSGGATTTNTNDYTDSSLSPQTLDIEVSGSDISYFSGSEFVSIYDSSDDSEYYSGKITSINTITNIISIDQFILAQIPNEGFLEKDSFTYNTGTTNYNEIILLDSNHIVVIYGANSVVGTLKIFSFDSNFEFTLITTYTYDAIRANYNSAVKISDTVFAISYEGSSGSRGYIHLFEVNESYGIENDNRLLHDSNDFSFNSLKLYDSSTLVLAYTSDSSRGRLKTFSFDASLNITEIDEIIFDSSSTSYISMGILETGSVAIAYQTSPDNGICKIFNIDGSYVINSTAVGSVTFDSTMGYQPWLNLSVIDSSSIAIMYRDSNDDGVIATYSLDGSPIFTLEDTYIHNSNTGSYRSFLKVDSENYIIIYHNSTTPWYGYLKHINIDSSLTITGDYEYLFNNTNNMYYPSMCLLDSENIAIVYSDSSNNGILKSFNINFSSNSLANYEYPPAVGWSNLNIIPDDYISNSGSGTYSAPILSAIEKTDFIADGTYSSGDLFTIKYDGSKILYYHNGSLVDSSTEENDIKLFLDSSFFSVGGSIYNVRFGPVTSNNYDDVGGTKPPADADKTSTQLAINNMITNAILDGVTMINGGYLRTQFIDTDAVLVGGIEDGIIVTQGYIKDTAENLIIDFANTKITVNSSDGLIIDSSGGMTVEGGGDISLVSETTNTAVLIFKHGSGGPSAQVTLGYRQGSQSHLAFIPNSSGIGVASLYFGYDDGATESYLSQIKGWCNSLDFTAHNSIAFRLDDNSSPIEDATISMLPGYISLSSDESIALTIDGSGISSDPEFTIDLNTTNMFTIKENADSNKYVKFSAVGQNLSTSDSDDQAMVPNNGDIVFYFNNSTALGVFWRDYNGNYGSGGIVN